MRYGGDTNMKGITELLERAGRNERVSEKENKV